MRFAYADPPYIGQARKHYKNQASYAGEVDHRQLLQRLYDEFPDGWALSASMTSLWDLIPMIPKDWKCRIGVWAKPFVFAKPNVSPMYAWEAVIFRGGRGRGRSPRDLIRDWIAVNTMQETGLPGTKPDEFCYWLFELLNMQAEDEFVDLFPGTGRVSRAWETWKQAKIALFVR